MTAIYNEIAYYAKCQFKPKSSILLIGSRFPLLINYLKDTYEITLGTEADLPTLLKTNRESFDAVIVLFKFCDYAEYKDAEQFLSILISLLKLGGLAQICEHTGDGLLNLSQYTSRFETHREIGQKSYGFKLIWEQCLRDSIYQRNDWNDHCWMLEKYELPPSEAIQSVRAFLDQHQYTEFGIRSYEWIFGAGFISPGGAAQNGQFLAQLNLQPGETVLDIGCGIGGNAFQIAKEYGSHVIGVDLSSNMITVACDRSCLRRDTRVRFMIADITKYDFPPNTFEVIYSRDAIIHIPDKKSLFTKCYKWLKPGGRMLITDYVIGEGQLSQEFQEYVKQRQYTLLPLKAYEKAASEAGFSKVDTVDITQDLKNTILKEMQRATDNKLEFMQMFSAEKFDYLVAGWKKKIVFIDSGCHKWGVLKAVKSGQ